MSYSAYKACQNVIDAFTAAVNKLLSELISHPDFETLIGAR